jgi:hypothetical protein
MESGLRHAPSLVALAAICAMAVLLTSCGLVDGGDKEGKGSATAAPSAAATPEIQAEEALRLWVERRLGVGFVVDCDLAERPGDVGKQCARFRGEREGLLAYELGPVFSEYTRLIILKQIDGAWTIEHLEERDPNLPPVPGIPWPLQVGASVVVAGTDDCLRVRESPGLQNPEVGCLDDGTAVTISEGPIDRDGLEWWKLEGHGWSAGDWLRYQDEAPAITATPEG